MCMNKRMSVIKYVSLYFVSVHLSLQLMKMYLCFYVYTSRQLYMFRGLCMFEYSWLKLLQMYICNSIQFFLIFFFKVLEHSRIINQII